MTSYLSSIYHRPSDEQTAGKPNCEEASVHTQKFALQRPAFSSLMAQLTVFVMCWSDAICPTGPTPGSCTTVSANTNNAFSTALSNKNNYQLVLSEFITTQTFDSYLYVASYDDNGREVYLFSIYADLRLSSTVGSTANGSNVDHYKSMVLKDPLKLFAASTDTPNNAYNTQYLYDVSLSGTTYALNNIGADNSINGTLCAISDPTSTYILSFSPTYLTKFQISSSITFVQKKPFSLSLGFFLGLASSNNTVIAGRTDGLYLINKADFSTILLGLRNNQSKTLNYYGWQVDNLNSSAVYAATGGFYTWISKYDLTSITSSYLDVVYTTGGYDQNTNNILNFGPYQYVVTIPINQANFALQFFQKLNIPAGATSVSLSSRSKADSNGITFAGGVLLDTHWYFAFLEDKHKNFQSYYITVSDTCVTRNASAVCTQCNTGYYRDSLNPNNNCVPISSFPLGYGADNSTMLMTACAAPNCTLCINDYTVCTNATGEFSPSNCFVYNVNQSCISTSQVPSGYGFSYKTGLVISCPSNCINCTQSVAGTTTCLKCDQPNNYFMNTTSIACVSNSSMLNTFGPNLVTGNIVSCTDSHCLNCSANYSMCQACNITANYWLNTSTSACTYYASIPSTYGPDAASGTIVNCTDNKCLTCQSNSTLCTACNTSQSYYLNTSSSSCVAVGSIPNNYGANQSNGNIVACSDSHCSVCNTNYLQCSSCDSSNNYYLYISNKTCASNSSLPAGLGPALNNDTILSCLDKNCLTCSADYMKCTTCNQSRTYNLNTTSHVCVLRSCADPNCLKCDVDYAKCNFCDASQFYYLDGVSCSPASQAPAGMGLNSNTSLLEACHVNNCEDCRPDSPTCTKCYESLGYYLEGNNCMLIDTRMRFISSSKLPSGVDMEYVLSTSPALNIDNTYFYSQLQAQLVWNLVFLKSSTGKQEMANVSQTPSSSSKGIVLDCKIKSKMEEQKYNINISFPQKYYNVTMSNGTIVRVLATKSQFPYKVTDTSGQTAAQLGTTINTAMAGIFVSNPAFMPALMAVIALDPTGVLMKFNQILKIINKLYFININYGIRLTAFLKNLGEKLGPSSNETDRYMVMHLKNYRGKLTNEKVTIEFLATMNYKIGLYLGTWLFRIINLVLMTFSVKVFPFYLQVMYYANYVHLIIFNLVFIDFIWYGCHSLMHAIGLPLSEQVTVLLCLTFITIDVTEIIQNLTSQRDWLYRITLHNRISQLAAEERKKMEIEDSQKKKEKSLLNSHAKDGIDEGYKNKRKASDLNDNDVADEEAKRQKEKESRGPISYSKTYEEIQSNYQLFKITAVNLNPVMSVYLNPMVRAIYFNHIMRTIIYQSIIIGGQYISGFVIGGLLAVEFSRVSYSIYCYVKYKYLKNIICLLMEVMQSSFLLAFLVIAIILLPKRFDEIILDFYQDAGIWIVIASCVAEYLLLLTYIGVAAYDFFKNRKANNRALARMKYSFIKYGSDPSANLNSTQPEIGGASIIPGSSTAKMDARAGSSFFNLNQSHLPNISSPHIPLKGMPTTKSIMGNAKNKLYPAQQGITKFGPEKMHRESAFSTASTNFNRNAISKFIAHKNDSPTKSGLLRVKLKASAQLKHGYSQINGNSVHLRDLTSVKEAGDSGISAFPPSRLSFLPATKGPSSKLTLFSVLAKFKKD